MLKNPIPVVLLWKEMSSLLFYIPHRDSDIAIGIANCWH